MTPARFQELDRLFQAALDLPAPQREPFLAVECADDPELLAELRSLLSSEAAAGEQLGDLVSRAAEQLEASPEGDASDVGLRLGSYLLVREIGRGGMAVVYQAIRADDEFLQTVAIKLVKRGMDSLAILRRFRAERQILASLSHPNIAALIDGGSHPDGRPYLVMEFIDGEPLLDYCRRRALPVKERLDLFRQICSAVDYAHHAHLIHRDIKPGNVMVTHSGVPKLLDFGIAKVLRPELIPGEPAATETNVRLMTPDYASPEQVLGLPLSSATDIYSLGVLLFELLTGARPFSLAAPSLLEIEKAICQDTAPLPSRATNEPRLREQLSGDLDTIVAMAMRKEPERRYATAAELADDLAAYLQGRPVAARPDTVTYRVSKWVRRRPGAAAALLLVPALMTLLLLLRGTGVNPEAVALHDRARTLMQADPRTGALAPGLPPVVAETLRLYERAVELDARYVPGWLGVAETAEYAIDFDAQRAGEMTAKALAAAKRCVELDPKQAKAWEVIGNVQAREWKFQAALDAYRRSFELNRGSPFGVRAYSNLLDQFGRTSEALAAVEAALGVEASALAPRARAVILVHKAQLLLRLGRATEAMEQAQAAARLDGTFRASYLLLGQAYEAAGRLQEARNEVEIALRLGPEDARVLASMGFLSARLGDGKRAEAVERKLLSMRASHRPAACALAVVYLGMDQRARALEMLATAAAEREPGLPSCTSDPHFREIRSSPEFRAVREKLGLPLP
ncbi:MAG: protein kinase [Bryobacteraceae bacterium]|nr:protein kinase [Bryobacteraceae bacterium]